MPAAPDLATLFQFERQIELAAVAVLTAAGVPAVAPQRATGNLDTPRVEVRLLMGAPTGYRKPLLGAKHNPRHTLPDGWHAQLMLMTVTNRKGVPYSTNGARHDELVGKCRVAMLQALGSFEAALQWLTINRVDDVGTVPTTDANTDLDGSPLVYALQFKVRADAWPTLPVVE